jgi:post-segregation antitoxin (ccd killing protein)
MSDSWLTLYEQANQASTDISALISEKISLDASKSSTAKVKAQLRKKCLTFFFVLLVILV